MPDPKKPETTTTTTATPSTSTSPPGSLMYDLKEGVKNLLGRKKRMAEADSIDADSGNPCHYQTHVGDKKGMNRQGRTSGVTCHHRKS